MPPGIGYPNKDRLGALGRAKSAMPPPPPMGAGASPMDDLGALLGGGPPVAPPDGALGPEGLGGGLESATMALQEVLSSGELSPEESEAVSQALDILMSVGQGPEPEAPMPEEKPEE